MRTSSFQYFNYGAVPWYSIFRLPHPIFSCRISMGDFNEDDFIWIIMTMGPFDNLVHGYRPIK